jgi:hypothetical protein
MRSSPPLQLALVLLGFLALAWPLIRLTTARPTAYVEKPPVAAAASIHALLRLRYAHVPTQLQVLLGGRTLFTQLTPPPQGMIETAVELPLTKDGLELRALAQWPAGTPDTALTVELEPDGLDAQSQTHWSTATALEATCLFLWPQ